MGVVLVTFAPPAASYTIEDYSFSKFRPYMSKVIEILISGALKEVKNESTYMLMTLPFMFLQCDGDRSDRALKCLLPSSLLFFVFFSLSYLQ